MIDLFRPMFFDSDAAAELFLDAIFEIVVDVDFCQNSRMWMPDQQGLCSQFLIANTADGEDNESSPSGAGACL